MTALFTFPADALACLPMTPGEFAFAKGTHPDPHSIRLEVVSVDELPVMSGRLVIADPLIQLGREGNPWLAVPPGVHLLGQTWAHAGAGQTGPSRVAYVSLILDKVRLGARRKWQKQQMDAGRDPSVPQDQLRLLHLTADGRPLGPHETSLADLISHAGVDVRSGTLGLVDAEALLEGMPLDRLVHKDHPQAVDWYDHYQAPDIPGSWLDALDLEGRHRKGAANVPLPKNPALRLGLSYAGWSAGAYPVLGEYATPEAGDLARPLDDLIAIHVDLGVLPHGPRRLGVPAGWAS